MKKILALMLALTMALSCMAYVTANEDGIKVTIDGVAQSYDVMPVLENDRTLVPMRGIFEALGAEITWEEATETVTGVKGDTTVVLQIGNTTAKVNGTDVILDVPAKLINDRTMVPVRFISESLGCTVDWEDATQTVIITSAKVQLPTYSKPIERDFILKQETFEGANPTKTKYNEFYSMAERAFIFPGLNQVAVPQSITYRAETNQFYLGVYFRNKEYRSAICVIDAETGALVGEYFLFKPDGAEHYGHMGGMTIGGGNLYFENGRNIHRISLATIDALGPIGDLQVEEAIQLTLGQSIGNDYLDYSNGYLWVGNFYYSESEDYSRLKVTDEYPFLIRGYKMDETQPDGFAQEYKVEGSEWYDYLPEILYLVEEEKIQGMTTVGNKIITSTSVWQTDSQFHIYDRTKTDGVVDTITLEGREIPIDRLKKEKTVSAPPYSEEIVPVGDYAYVTFESGALAFRDQSDSCPTDSVWKIELDKLLASN